MQFIWPGQTRGRFFPVLTTPTSRWRGAHPSQHVQNVHFAVSTGISDLLHSIFDYNFRCSQPFHSILSHSFLFSFCLIQARVDRLPLTWPRLVGNLEISVPQLLRTVAKQLQLLAWSISLLKLVSFHLFYLPDVCWFFLVVLCLMLNDLLQIILINLCRLLIL